MLVAICGAGKVGSFLADNLTSKGHRVVVIEKKMSLCERLAARTGALVINGDGCDVRFQTEAQVDRADVFAAVTGDDDDNLVACLIASTIFGVERTVARVNNPKNEHIFHNMGIDAISSTTVISSLIEEEATIGEILTLHTLHRGKQEIVEIQIPRKHCRACNSMVKDLGLPRECVLVTIIRGDEVIIPRGPTMIMPGDQVMALTSTDKVKMLKEILTGS